MNVALWIVAGLLAAASLASGAVKLTQPVEKLAASGWGWVGDFGGGTSGPSAPSRSWPRWA